MKKAIFAAALAALLLAACAEQPFFTQGEDDAMTFKQAYEALNDQLDEQGQPKYTPLSIPSDNRAVILDFDQTMQLLSEGDGLLYIGRPGCPWCRLLLPTLLQFAKDKQIPLYYYDAEASRAANDDDYQQLVAYLYDYLLVDEVTQQPGSADFDPNKRRLILPHLFFLNEGQIVEDLLAYRDPLLDAGDTDGVYAELQQCYDAMQAAD